MRPTGARMLAVGVVERVLRDDAWAPGVLDAALKSASLDRRESAFATRLAYGTVELMPTLERAIRERANRTSRIKPRVLSALVVSAYEILALGTPAAVAVDQGVALVKARDPHAAGFANAVLRRLAADAPAFPWGDPERDLAVMARMTGFGGSLVERLASDLGEDCARETMRGSVGPPPFYVAANPLCLTAADLVRTLVESGITAREEEPAGCIVCDEPALALASGIIEDGRAIIADRAAQIVAALVPLGPGFRIVDAAAGRGNKAALLAFAARRAGLEIAIDAVDVHGWKTDVVRERMELLGVSCVSTHALDATDASAMHDVFGAPVDAVLIDAPCTNIGTLRRHPEGRWRFESGMPGPLAALGGSLLDAASSLVRPGGFVVYSTCTVLPAENEQVVGAFLARPEGCGFRVVDVTDRLPQDVRSFVTAEGYLQSIPMPGGMDGHFAALLQRRC